MGGLFVPFGVVPDVGVRLVFQLAGQVVESLFGAGGVVEDFADVLIQAGMGFRPVHEDVVDAVNAGYGVAGEDFLGQVFLYASPFDVMVSSALVVVCRLFGGMEHPLVDVVPHGRELLWGVHVFFLS